MLNDVINLLPFVVFVDNAECMCLCFGEMFL
jgi:hypothetical protein